MPSCTLIRGFFLGAVALSAIYADNAPPLAGETTGGGQIRRSSSSSSISSSISSFRIMTQEDTCDLTCQIVTESNRYETESNEIVSFEETTCIRVVDGIPTFTSYYVTIPKELAEKYKNSIKDGKLLLSIRGARLVGDAVVLDDDDDAQFTVLDASFSPAGADERAGRRQLLESKDATDAFGERHLIAFRINGQADEEKVLNTTTQIHRALFDDGISVKTQYEKCSIEKLTWIAKGVYDVYLPRALDSFESALDVRNFVIDGIHQFSITYKAHYGTSDVRDVAHNIMFCVPPSNHTAKKVALCNDAREKCRANAGSKACHDAQDKCDNWKPQGFIANAQSGGAITMFSNKWCADLSTVIHELGHNLGRGHAGRNDNPYGDASSNMSGGGNVASATAPQKCFNGAQHKEFGWYKDHILRFNPAVDGNKMIKLASFVDVRKAGPAKEEPVIIELGDYNIQWNQAKDYNEGAGMKDRITVVTNSIKGTTWVVAELHLDDSLYQEFTFQDKDANKVYVNYCGRVDGSKNSPDAVFVGIGLRRSACQTISAPTPAPLPECTYAPYTRVYFEYSGQLRLSRCHNLVANYGSQGCNFDVRGHHGSLKGYKVYTVCQTTCADHGANCIPPPEA